MTFPWHKKVWNQFVFAREHDHLPHALLLVGEEGIGKQALANSMVKSLLCLSPSDQVACNNCKACKTYEADANPDYLHITLLEKKTQIGVDQIRALSSFLNYTSSFNGHRVVLLNPIERMNNNAANSLLKSLEEPAQGTFLILLATHLNTVLPTIKSRCQLLHVNTPNKTQALAWINENAPELENPEIALESAQGKPLHAININQEMLDKKAQLANDLLEVINHSQAITTVAKSWEKFDLTTLLDWQLHWLQAFIKNEELTPTLTNIKTKISTEHQWQLYQQILAFKRLVHTSVNPLIFIENMIVLWTTHSQK